MAKSHKSKRLEQLAEQIRACTKCPLHASRTLAVPGEGKPSAKVMLIGEAPGKAEDARGQPFVGAAGRYLNQILERNGIARTDCFITNTVKCRPPGNRTPRKEEVDTCTANYLAQQIELVNPKVVLLLGLVAAKKLLGVASVSKGRRRVFKRGKRKYLVGYHPAAWPTSAAKIQQDFARLRRELEKP